MKRFLNILALILSASFCLQASAATFTINDGDVASLITAITTSNSNGADDTIELATNGTYTLTTVDNTSSNGANGLPVILSDTGHVLVIHGNGATLQRSAAGGTPAFRIFQIGTGADVTIDRLTIMNGTGTFGGGIFNDGFAGNATLTITNSTVSRNSVSDAGGGIYNGQATLILNNSTVSGNSTSPNPGGFGGGGIINIVNFSGSATLTINNSTISGNSATTVGGGIENVNQGIISAIGATLTINNSTLSGNSAGLSGVGGGIDNVNDGTSGNATLTIGATILNAGASGANIRNVLGTVTSLGYNLSSDDASALLNQSTDQNSTNPMLGPLADNGGPTFTHALLTGSPAIDKGKNFSGSTTDQRGTGFVRTFDNPAIPNATGGDGTDIGAFEVQGPPVCPLGQGNWKNNPDAWPVTSLMLGSQTYTKTELLMILHTPIGTGKHADASLILADQLIAAKLNIANGSDPTPVSSTITNADGLLSGFSGKLPYHVRPSSATGQMMVNDASVLDNYNNGLLTTGCTPTPTPTP